jgi:hypothetical protein
MANEAFPTHFVFNHFPKAGGTSFFTVLKRNIPESTISPQLMEQEVRLVRPEQFEHFRLIRGHFSVLTHMGFSRNRYSMTLLRHPISTIVSTYNFWRNRKEEDPVSAEAKRMTFAEFVRRFADSPTIIHDTYTHHFAAVSRDYPGEPADKSLLLAYAKHNLAAFNFVGVCEEFNQSVRLLCRELGWLIPAVFPHENRSPEIQSADAIDPETYRILLDRNQLDLQLYEYGKDLFRSRCQAVGKASEFAQNLKPPEVNNGLPDNAQANRFFAFPLPVGLAREAFILQVKAEWLAGKLAITIDYSTRIPIPGLMAGIMVVNANGEVLYGTTTWIEQVELVQQPGAICRVAFEVDCSVAPGLYSVGAALAHPDRPGFHYDWIDRAAMFSVPAPAGASRIWAGLRGWQLSANISLNKKSPPPAIAPDLRVSRIQSTKINSELAPSLAAAHQPAAE